MENYSKYLKLLLLSAIELLHGGSKTRHLDENFWRLKKLEYFFHLRPIEFTCASIGWPIEFGNEETVLTLAEIKISIFP